MAKNSISKIKAVLSKHGGTSSPHSFRVKITPPLGLRASISEDFTILCESVSLPGRQFATTDQPIYGSIRKMPWGPIYNELSLTYICTDNMQERYFFDAWQSMIQNPTNNYMEYYDTYVSPRIVIEKLNGEGDVVYKMFVEEAYPMTIEAQELSYDATDQYLKLDIKFAYLKWKNIIDEVISGGTNLASGITGTLTGGLTPENLAQISQGLIEGIPAGTELATMKLPDLTTILAFAVPLIPIERVIDPFLQSISDATGIDISVFDVNATFGGIFEL